MPCFCEASLREDAATARVTLSFDNGPDLERTPRLLDVLERLEVRATFFVVGRELARPGARSVAERAQADGHWIGNHSYTHRVPLGEDASPDAVLREIVQTQELLGPLTHPSRWFRPFGRGGQLDNRLLSAAALERLRADGYSCVLWNCVPRDWEDAEAWPDVAFDALASQPWTLVVLHDFVDGNHQHVERFVTRCRDAGHEIVQEFPPDCVPLDCGELRAPMDRFVS